MADIKRDIKISELVNKFGITKERAKFIIETDERYLSIEDFKIKYSIEDFNQLPKWLTSKELELTIYKAINQYSCDLIKCRHTTEDLYIDIQIFIRKNIHKIPNHKYLKAVIVNYLLGLKNKYIHENNIVPYSLNQPIKNTNDNYDWFEFGSTISSKEDENIVNLISTVRNKQVRSFLIVVGYIICDIIELEDLFKQLVDNSKDEIQKDLIKLEEIYKYNKLVEQERFDNSKCTLRKTSIKISSIVNILRLNENPYSKLVQSSRKIEKFSAKEILEEIRFYIKTNKIFEN